MCMHSTELHPCRALFPSARQHRRLQRPSVQVRRLNRRRVCSKEAKGKKVAEVGVKTQMEIKNWKLYMENRSIIEENEKLRKKALLLHQENQALLFQLQKKFSQPNNNNNGNH